MENSSPYTQGILEHDGLTSQAQAAHWEGKIECKVGILILRVPRLEATY